MTRESEMTTRINEPAFPVTGFMVDASGALCGETVRATGLSLRDYFAGQAIIALTAGCPITDDDASWCHPLIAEDAYKLADAMLTVRTKQPDPTP
jgi:hypothetical protein